MATDDKSRLVQVLIVTLFAWIECVPFHFFRNGNRLRLVLYGSAVGKTCLIYRLVHDEFKACGSAVSLLFLP